MMIKLTDADGAELLVRPESVALVIPAGNLSYAPGVNAVVVVQSQRIGVQQTMQQIEQMLEGKS